MNIYLAVYLGSAAALEQSAWDVMDDQQREAREASGMQAWGDWMTTNADRIVDAGGPLGKTKRVSSDGVADTTNTLVGYVTLRAESHDAAAALFASHPHFAVFPGDSVEVMPCLPIPGAP